MTTFLRNLAIHLTDRYGSDFSSLCVVLPNRRGGLYLKKELAAIAGKPIWAPEIFSIEDFTSQISGFRLAENTTLLFELYEVHREILGVKAQDFGEFLSWAPQLLHDFNDIDSYLVDAGHLFSHLSEARALSLWNLDSSPLTDFQKNYLAFYRSLKDYYLLFTQRLAQSRHGYPGLILRRAAENLSGSPVSLPWDHLIFAGFNALTKAEEIIFSNLYVAGKTELIWDADHYYLDDPDQEAGDFLRRWKTRYGDSGFYWIHDHLRDHPATITVTGVPGNIGQVKYCGDLLSRIRENGYTPEESAVVLMDEQLLVPLLNSVPSSVSSLNITMGLPLKNSPFFTLFDSILQMHVNLEKFTRARESGKTRFYFRDVMKVLSHPSMLRLFEFALPGNVSTAEEILRNIRFGGRAFLTLEEILEAIPGLFRVAADFLVPVFGSYSQPEDALANLKLLVGHLRDSIMPVKDPEHHETMDLPADIRMESLFSFSNVVWQVETVMKKYRSVTSLKTFHKLFRQLAASTSLPFYGEPLRGLQVMGMLETRTLDFRNLILLSFNEDLIPGDKSIHSFIPYDIRSSFNLPVYHHRNSVYAYHFYRLLQRAENVNVLYNTEPDDLGGGEKSRFITQLIQELPLRNPGVKIISRLLHTPPQPVGSNHVVMIPKTEDVLKMLHERAEKGFSPSALNDYRRCPLKFYFSFVAGIEESKEIEDAIDPQILGSAVHETLQNLFDPFKNIPVSIEDIDGMIPLIHEMLLRAFGKHFSGSDLNYGKNFLLVNVAEIMIRNFLQEEKRNVVQFKKESRPWTILLLEKRVTGSVHLDDEHRIMDVPVKGFIDRVDRVGNVIRIIDYKTGVVEQNELKLKDWESLKNDPSKDKVFQLLMYACMLEESSKNEELRMEAGIFSLRRIRSGFIPVVLPDGNEKGPFIDKEGRMKFRQVLTDLLREIFNPGIPFFPAQDQEVCMNCPWVNLCGR